MTNYVHGRVRLATASPRVSEYDYGTKSYSPPDYYGGDHFLYRGDPNLLPDGNGMYSSSSPYTSEAITAYPPQTLFSISAVPSVGVYGNPDAESLVGGAAAEVAGEEGGFDLIGTATSIYEWSQSDEGKAAINTGKQIYDASKKIGSGGSSDTLYKGIRINNMPIGTIPTDQLVEIMKEQVSKLVPAKFATESDIPEISKGSFVSSLTNKGPLAPYPMGVRLRIRIYNACRRELISRFGSLQNAGYIPAFIDGAVANGKSGMSTTNLLIAGGVAALAVLLLKRK